MPQIHLGVEVKGCKMGSQKMAKVSYKEPLSGIKKKGVAKEYSDYLGSIGDM